MDEESFDTEGWARKLVVERLGDRKYQDRSAEEHILLCYKLRNRLVHGGQPYPTLDEVVSLVGGLDEMVWNLLCGSLLEYAPE